MAYEIRAMSLGEIVDTSFQVLRNHFVPLVAISAIVNVPVALGQAIIEAGAQGADAPTLPLLLIAISFLSIALLSPIVTAAVTGLIGEVYLGRKAEIGASFRVALRILLPLLGTSLLAGILYLLGTLALIFRFDRTQVARLGAAEGQLVRQALRRIEGLPPEAAERLLAQAVDALRARLAYEPVPAEGHRAFLMALLRELRRR